METREGLEELALAWLEATRVIATEEDVDYIEGTIACEDWLMAIDMCKKLFELADRPLPDLKNAARSRHLGWGLILREPASRRQKACLKLEEGSLGSRSCKN